MAVMSVPGSRAIVIGGSVAGLLAAQALSESFDDISIVERDRLADVPEHRAGVPQDRHVHTLWAGGMRAIEQLLPDLEAELRAAGGARMAFWSEFRWLLPVGRWLPQWPAQQHLVISTRALLEHVIRARVKDVRAGAIRGRARGDRIAAFVHRGRFRGPDGISCRRQPRRVAWRPGRGCRRTPLGSGWLAQRPRTETCDRDNRRSVGGLRHATADHSRRLCAEASRRCTSSSLRRVTIAEVSSSQSKGTDG